MSRGDAGKEGSSRGDFNDQRQGIEPRRANVSNRRPEEPRYRQGDSQGEELGIGKKDPIFVGTSGEGKGVAIGVMKSGAFRVVVMSSPLYQKKSDCLHARECEARRGGRGRGDIAGPEENISKGSLWEDGTMSEKKRQLCKVK